MASSAVDIASPRSKQLDLPASQQSPLAVSTAKESTTIGAKEDTTQEDDLDPAAFLKSVRELSERREKEDNERVRRLEEEIEKGRQKRLARRAEDARSISPEKRQQQAETPRNINNAANNNTSTTADLHTPSSTLAAFGSPSPLVPFGSASIASMAQNEPSQRPPSMEQAVPEFKGFGSIKRDSAPSRPVSDIADSSSPKPSPSNAMPTRSNTMKWQQRPASRGGRPMSMAAPSPTKDTSTEEIKGPREQPALRASTSRPMSMAAPSPTRDIAAEEPQPSRDQIAASLGARDPAYFRQTADRGLGNAAFRKSKDETSSGDDVFAARRGLPGMSKESTLGEERTSSPRPESVTSETPSRFGSIREDRAWSARSSGTPSISEGKQSSDLPFRTPSNRSSATTDINEPSGLGRTPTMSASQARLAGASDRPPSPTKGMGGFVQSALMKRSDSQNKRWSAQPVGGLQRADSTASARSGLGGLQGSYSMPKLDPTETSSRNINHEGHSRPSSSSSNLAELATQGGDGGVSRPNLPSRLHSRSKSVASNYSTSADQDGGLKSPLGSPSKRFSPNKSSWIESALARPDSPKLAASRPAQPSWMENIAKAKAHRASTEVVPTLGSPNPNDRSRPSSPTKETPFGPALLKRSDSRDMRPEAGSMRSDTPPTRAKPSSLSSRPASLLTQESLQLSEKMAAPTTRDETLDFKLETKAAPIPEMSEAVEKPAPLGFKKKSPVIPSETSAPESTPQKLAPTTYTPTKAEPVKSPPATKPKPDSVVESPDVGKSSPTLDKAMPPPLSTLTKPSTAPKPEPVTKPVTDFRSTLRSRPVSRPSSEDKPEFMSKFGSLRKAQPEKYVAPDVLKDNITRGKRSLTITDGPQKTERKDELRDSLIAKKEQWKQEKEAGIKHERTPSGPAVTAERPEALATRELLGRKKSIKGPPRSPEKSRNITPEALRFQKSIREKPKVDAPVTVEPLKARLVDVSKPEVSKPEVSKPEAKTTLDSPLTKAVTEPARRLPSPTIKQDPVPEPLGRTASLPRANDRAASPAAVEKSGTFPPAAAPTSKLAARFNPGLANMLARGPPGSGASPSGSRSESPAGIETSRSTAAAAIEPPAPGAPLVDVRKGRAKGPKKSKGGASAQKPKTVEPEAPKQDTPPTIATDIPSASLDAPSSPTLETKPSPAIKPSARFGGVSSTASIMAASLNSTQTRPSASPRERAASPALSSTSFSKPTLSPKPSLSPNPSTSSPKDRVLSAGSQATSFSRPSVSPKPSMTGFNASQTNPSPAVQPLSFSKRVPSDKPATPLKDDVKSVLSEKPATPLKDDVKRVPSDKPATPLKDNVPEFKGFGSRFGRPITSTTNTADENKENTNSSSPSVKDAASTWGRKKTYLTTGAPSQIQLPTRKDEEAAMRSASLLASSPGRSPARSPARSPSRPGSSNGLGITSPIASPSPALPPKPAKSSRIVSGQLKEASPNKLEDSQSLEKLPETEAERLLVDSFGSWPTSTGPLSIDTQAIITSCSPSDKRKKTLRKSIQQVAADGTAQQLRQQEEYTLFDESVYVCSHTHIPEGGVKATHVIVWSGGSSTSANVEAANNVAKAEARREGSAQTRLNPQGHEQAELFEALGGILITRRGARETASKQYMLCGRKHLGHIAFDEVDFASSSLSAGFAYLISFPVTLQETKLYLWKGSACSNEEIGAAKLAAMDLSETGEIIEVDQGAEFTSFLKIFGASTTKSSIPRSLSLWKHKASAPDKFTARLFNIQQSDARTGIFSSMFRRPSWGMRAPAPEPGVKAEVKEISPFTQSDLDAEGLYLLDAYGELYLLLGPLFFSLQPENVRNALLAQSLLFASDYAILSASLEDRPSIPKASVVFGGCPEGVQWLFRGWDDEHGLWGLGGLMAGSSMSKGKIGEEVKKAGVEELVRVVCR